MINGRTYAMREGDIILLGPNDLHRAFETRDLVLRADSYRAVMRAQLARFLACVYRNFSKTPVGSASRLRGKQSLARSVLQAIHEDPVRARTLQELAARTHGCLTTRTRLTSYPRRLPITVRSRRYRSAKGPIIFPQWIAETAGIAPAHLYVSMIGLNHNCWFNRHDPSVSRHPEPIPRRAPLRLRRRACTAMPPIGAGWTACRARALPRAWTCCVTGMFVGLCIAYKKRRLAATGRKPQVLYFKGGSCIYLNRRT